MGIFAEFSRVAATMPGSAAIRSIDLGKEVSFAELRALSLKYASVSRPGLNLIIMRSGPDAMAAFLGCIAAGCLPAMLSHPDGRESPADWRAKIAKICEIVKPAAIFADPDFASMIGSISRCPVITEPGDTLPAINESDNIAFVQFSSGTTGLQKGVMISHEAVIIHNAVYDSIVGLSGGKVFSWLPLYHDMGLIACFLMPLMLGVPVVFMSPFSWVANPKSMMDAIDQNRCTHCWMPNFAFKFMADRVKQGKWDLSCLKQVVNCSEPCYPSAMKAFSDKFAPMGLDPSSITTCYAMAENVFAMAHGIGSGFKAEADLLPSVKAKIAEDGEIWIKSPFAFTCYRVEYALETQPTLFVDGYYPTGDLGFLSGGKIVVNGRKKDLIIVEGKNIHPNDIEQVIGMIDGVHPGRYVALGEHNANRGTEEIVIACEAKAGRPDDLKRKIRERIANEMHLSAKEILILPHGWLRKTSSGKIARSANLEKIKEHRGRVDKGMTILHTVLNDFCSPVICDADTNLLESGILSSVDLFTVVLEMELALGVGLGGAFSMYAEKNSSIRHLVFFAERKIYGEGT